MPDIHLAEKQPSAVKWRYPLEATGRGCCA